MPLLDGHNADADVLATATGSFVTRGARTSVDSTGFVSSVQSQG